MNPLLKGGRLPALDGLRAIAVLLVILSHTLEIDTGRLGVNLFFALSGFLITWLLILEHRSHDTISLSAFAMRRVLRIFPAYYAYLLLIFCIETLQGTSNLTATIGPALLYVQNYFVALTPYDLPEIQHVWSLCVEEQFYLIWPVVFLLSMRSGIDRAIRLVVHTIIIVLLWRSFAWLVLDLEDRYIYRAFDTRIDSILVGCLLALMTMHEQWRQHLDRITASAMVVPAIALTLSLSIYLTATFPDYGYTLGFTLDGILLAVGLLACMRHSKRVYLGWLDSRPLIFIGAISYPAYLYHELGESFASKAMNLAGLSSMTLLTITTLIVTFVLAYGSYRLLEQPILQLRHRFTRPTQNPTVRPQTES